MGALLWRHWHSKSGDGTRGRCSSVMSSDMTHINLSSCVMSLSNNVTTKELVVGQHTFLFFLLPSLYLSSH